jgi:hypothetical protein
VQTVYFQCRLNCHCVRWPTWKLNCHCVRWPRWKLNCHCIRWPTWKLNCHCVRCPTWKLNCHGVRFSTCHCFIHTYLSSFSPLSFFPNPFKLLPVFLHVFHITYTLVYDVFRLSVILINVLSVLKFSTSSMIQVMDNVCECGELLYCLAELNCIDARMFPYKV